MNVFDLATWLTVATALMFVWRVVATIRRMSVGDGAGAMPPEGLHSDWPDDLRDLPRPEPPIALPMPLTRISIYAELVGRLGFDPMGG